jgi:DNA-binding transcriptional LysR family regulator
MLRQGDIDLGFQYGEVRDEEIEHTVIGRARICLAIPTELLTGANSGSGASSNCEQGGQPEGWREVFELPWVWVGDDCPFYKTMLEQAEVVGSVPDRRISAVDERVVRELVVAGQGVAMMREDEARPLADEGKVAIWDKGWIDLPLSIAWLTKNRQESRIQAVRQVVTSVWRDQEVWDEMPWVR